MPNYKYIGKTNPYYTNGKIYEAKTVTHQGTVTFIDDQDDAHYITAEHLAENFVGVVQVQADALNEAIQAMTELTEAYKSARSTPVWKRIDSSNIPDDAVLALAIDSYDGKAVALYGEIYKDTAGNIYCITELGGRYEVTHYIEVKELLKWPRE